MNTFILESRDIASVENALREYITNCQKYMAEHPQIMAGMPGVAQNMSTQIERCEQIADFLQPLTSAQIVEA